MTSSLDSTENLVVVALANKLARICRAVLAGEGGFVEEMTGRNV